jgi:hypothetical protein
VNAKYRGFGQVSLSIYSQHICSPAFALVLPPNAELHSNSPASSLSYGADSNSPISDCFISFNVRLGETENVDSFNVPSESKLTLYLAKIWERRIDYQVNRYRKGCKMSATLDNAPCKESALR